MTAARWIVDPESTLAPLELTGITSWLHVEDLEGRPAALEPHHPADAALDLTLPLLTLRAGDLPIAERIRLLVDGDRVLSAGGGADAADRIAAQARWTTTSSGSASTALRILIEVAVAGGSTVVAALTAAVEAVELDLLGDRSDGAVRHLHDLSRQVLHVRRALVELDETVENLYADAAARTRRLVADVTDLGTALSTALQVALTEASVRQNDDMRTISAWAAVWAAPTLVAGVYGMNFRHMPELGWVTGYPAALLLMAALAWAARRAFRRSGWL